MTARGIRNNNPLNLERTHPRQGWAGALPDGQLTDPRFEQFTTAYWGLRAGAIVLLGSQVRHGRKTIAAIINAFAPPIENATSAYALYVANALGVGVDAPVDLTNEDVLCSAVKAMVHVEDTENPYDDATVRDAVRAALSSVCPSKAGAHS